MAGGSFQAGFGGVEDMRKLGADLRRAGAKDLRKELMKAGRDAGKIAQGKVRQHALSDLPHSKGLNVWVASHARVTAQTRLTGPSVGLSLKIKHRGVKGLSDLPAINDGRLRHPTFGDEPWVLQLIAPGFAGRAIDEVGETLVKGFLAAVDETARKLRAGG